MSNKKMLELAIQSHKSLTADLKELEDKNKKIFEQRNHLRNELMKFHKMANWLKPEGAPCPVHGHHHAKSSSGSASKYISETMTKAGNQPLTVAELEQGMKELGWKTGSADPAGVIRNTLRRMLKSKIVEKNDQDGTYFLPDIETEV